MFELSDMLPYLFSIGLICTVSYAYIAHLYCGLQECRIESGRLWNSDYPQPIVVIIRCESPVRLSRMIRRKESPDEDVNTDCTSSSLKLYLQSRGGFTWDQIKDSLPRDGLLDLSVS